MRICDLLTSVNRLQREARQLQERWSETKESWRDQRAKEFEETYLEPLIPHLKLALAAVYELQEVVQTLERECGDQQYLESGN